MSATEQKLSAKEKITAAYAAGPDRFVESLEEILEQLESFSADVPRPERTLDFRGNELITVVSGVSEAGDRFLEIFPGVLSSQEIVAEIFLSNIEWWGELEAINLEEIQVLRIR